MTKNKKEKPSVQSVQGYGKKVSKKCPTWTLPPHGKHRNRNLRVLAYLNNKSPGTAANVRACSRKLGIPRSTLYIILEKLLDFGYISKPNMGSYNITSLGKDILNGSDFSRLGGPKSAHHMNFICELTHDINPEEIDFRPLLPVKTHTIDLKNYKQRILYFDDATIIVNIHQITLWIKIPPSNDNHLNYTRVVVTATNYLEELNKLGLDMKTVRLEKEHYSEAESALSHFLERIGDKFRMTFSNGKHLFIDRSLGDLEHEVDDKATYDKLTNFLDDAIMSGEKVSDMGHLKEIVANLTQIHLLELKGKLLSKKEPEKEEDKPDYFG